MRKFKVIAFGATRDILGGKESVIEMTGATVHDLRIALEAQYPALVNLRSLFIAVNREYADEQLAIQEGDEIALIPPVSGG